MNGDDEHLSAAEVFHRAPRPLAFVRVRLYRGGQAEYVRDLLLDDKEDLFKDLFELRSAGKTEGDDEVQEVRRNLNYVINAIKDIERGMIELVGPDIP